MKLARRIYSPLLSAFADSSCVGGAENMLVRALVLLADESCCQYCCGRSADGVALGGCSSGLQVTSEARRDAVVYPPHRCPGAVRVWRTGWGALGLSRDLWPGVGNATAIATAVLALATIIASVQIRQVVSGPQRAAAADAAVDLVVLSDDLVPDPRMVRDLHSRGVPHLPVRVRDGTGLVGPLVIPGMFLAVLVRGLNCLWPARTTSRELTEIAETVAKRGHECGRGLENCCGPIAHLSERKRKCRKV